MQNHKYYFNIEPQTPSLQHFVSVRHNLSRHPYGSKVLYVERYLRYGDSSPKIESSNFLMYE